MTQNALKSPPGSAAGFPEVGYVPSQGIVPREHSVLQPGCDSPSTPFQTGSLPIQQNNYPGLGPANRQYFNALFRHHPTKHPHGTSNQDPLQNPEALKLMAAKLRKEEVNLIIQLFR